MKAVALLTALMAVAAAAPLSAQTSLPVVAGACSVNDVTTTAAPYSSLVSDCRGYYGNNLLNTANQAYQVEALRQLGFQWDGLTTLFRSEGLNGASSIGLGNNYHGLLWIGIHKGRGSPNLPNRINGTSFYRLDLNGANALRYTLGGSSTLVIYGAAVPEPSTWAMMILGVGATGAALRRRRRLAIA